MNDKPCGNNKKWCENCVSKGKCDYTRSDITKEKAIDLLSNLIGMVEDNHKSDYDKALKMGIEALEKLDKIEEIDNPCIECGGNACFHEDCECRKVFVRKEINNDTTGTKH